MCVPGVAQLKAGRITQEEYDQLADTDGMSEEEYLKELEMEESGESGEMSEEAQRVVRGMTSASGVEFAPWMKVDAEKIAQAKKDRAARLA